MGFIYLRPHPKSAPPAIPLPEVERNQLVLREGKLFTKTGTLFSGFVIELYEGGNYKSRSVISNGVLEGLSEGWHTNGVLAVSEHFTNGISHGFREKWYENGNKMSEAPIIAGKIEGLFRRWDKNGQLAEEIEMKQGEANGTARSYYASGYLKAEAILKNGELLDKTNWEEGQKFP